MLSALMVLSLLPASAFAAVNGFTYIYVGGTNILNRTDYKATYGDGYVQFDATTNTLTLHDATISIRYNSVYAGIHIIASSAISGGITINLEGTNTITGSGTPTASWYAIRIQDTYSCPVTITSDGTGSLAISNSYYGIYGANSGATTISDCAISVDNITYYGIYSNGSFNVSNADVSVNVTGTSTSSYGINLASSNVANISNGSVVNVTCARSSAIYSTKRGSATVLTVSDSNLTCTANGSKAAIYLASMNVTGDSTVIADGGINLFSTNTNYTNSGYSYLTLSPTSSALQILVGSDASSATKYGTYSSETSFVAPTALEYTVYGYFMITPGSGSSNGPRAVIYLNEDYHAVVLTRNNRRYLACIPHTVDSTGHCTVCKEYIGTEEETVTIDGVEYTVAYSEDINLASAEWDTTDLSDASLVEALATEGSVLVVTRSEETNIVFDTDAGTYDKFGLVNSWWSGDWIVLGTAGYASGDEDGVTVIDCISDDGTTVMYDGITVYNEWAARGMNAGGSALFITNSSGSYTITNVTVLVPVE